MSEKDIIHKLSSELDFERSKRKTLQMELQAKEHELIMAKADLCRGCQYKNDYKDKEQECEELKSNNKILRNMWETADRNNAKHVVQTDKYKQVLDEIYDTVANNNVIIKEDVLNKIDEVKRQ